MKNKTWPYLNWEVAAVGAILVGFVTVVVVSIGFWVVPRIEWADRLWDFVWKFVGIAIIGILYVGVTKLWETTIANAFAFLLLIALSVLVAIYVINFLNFMDLVSFWMRFWMRESVVLDILMLIFIGIVLAVPLGAGSCLLVLWEFWSDWRTWNKKIKVSGLYESAAAEKFRHITVFGRDGMDIVRVSVYDTGRVVVARPGGSPTGIGEKIIISRTFQVKRSIWHGDENSGEWDTFELVKGAQLEGVASEGEVPSEGV